MSNTAKCRTTSTPVTPDTKSAISNLENMWQQVESIQQKLHGDCLHARPANSFTVEEYCERFGLGWAGARATLHRMVRAGSLHKYKVLMPDAIGRMVVQNVYAVD